MKYLVLYCCLFCLVACSNSVQPPQQIDLNGDWKFRQVGHKSWTKALVPGVVQLDMLRAGLIENPFYGKNELEIGWIELEDWEYERNFEVDVTLLEQDAVDLVLEGVDTYASILINGNEVLETDNMFCAWRVACKQWLQSGNNTIRVRLRSPIKEKEAAYKNLGYQLPAGNDAGQLKVSPLVRKAPYHFGWDWGPRIVTTGIWRPIRLEAYSVARVADVYFEQEEVNASVAKIKTQLQLEATQASALTIVVKDGGKILAEQPIETAIGANSYNLDFEINQPQLWWSNGFGKPHLYEWTVELKQGSQILTSQTQKVGLRSIELVRTPDSIGTSYYFKLNGVPVFMKGANYIPQDNLLPRVEKKHYQQTVQNAVDANMNMLRVWGGGIYEDDVFYDLCDEQGILVWQDFIFACSMYPSDANFVNNVQREIEQNVKRLRRHACIALWCGNNELEVAWNNWGWQTQFGYSEADSTTIIKGYQQLFEALIPQTVQRLHRNTAYVPTSPLSNWGTPENFNHHSMHYWGVWHGREPFENYKTNVGRFMSEYGFQSFPEMNTIAAFADSTQWDLESEVMQHHQKSYIGNGMILKHLEQYFPKPKNFKDFVYLSQLTQAHGMEMAILSHRRDRRCMGTLYWQMNDCWTGPSWSSVDYLGNWKALHYRVRDWYDSYCLIPEIQGDSLTVLLASDVLEKQEGTLHLELMDLDGTVIWNNQKTMNLGVNKVQKLVQEDLKEALKGQTRAQLLIKVKLNVNGKTYQGLHYLVPPKDLALKKSVINKVLKKTDMGYALELMAPSLVKNLYLEVAGKKVHYSNNYFDLLPNQQQVIELKTTETIHVDDIHYRSVNDWIVE